MATFLFNDIIFGPVVSRRLGISLGINLLPADKKFCNFDCLYCECGWTDNEGVSRSDLPTRSAVRDKLREKISRMKKSPDVITFAGNGEPTLHPDFPGIIDDAIEIRNSLCKDTDIAVLSNSTTLHKDNVLEALRKIEQPILKLDTALENSFRTINQPTGKISLHELINRLSEFGDRLIIQTLFFEGNYRGQYIDNSSGEELDQLIESYIKIAPSRIMIYTFDRDTPLASLQKIPGTRLTEIGDRLRSLGFDVEISG